MNNDPNLVYATEPLASCDPEILVPALDALAITGVRTYSIVGAGGGCLGVYPWSSGAPAGQYEHVQVAAADAARIQAVIAAHPAAVKTQSDADAIAAAWDTLRGIRDRWLDACQIIFDQIATPGSHDLPSTMTDAITTNSQAWLDWRDAMRALPEQKSLDPLATAAAAPAGSTSDPWGPPWPQPPAAPTRRL